MIRLVMGGAAAKEDLERPPEEGGVSLGARLARLRKARGLTQTELAESTGLYQAIISNYERDRLRIPADALIKFAKALDISADELLGLTEASTDDALPRRLMKRLRALQTLPRRDQDALIRMIDSLVAAKKEE